MKFFIFAILFIVMIVMSLVIYGIISPRGYIDKAVYFYQTKLWMASPMRWKTQKPPYTCSYGKRHWDKPQGYQENNSGYFAGPSLMAFKKSDEQYTEEHSKK